MKQTTRLRAAWVLPISGDPIEDGEVIIEGDCIAEVRSASGRLSSETRDFGDAILMPGLINVHTHLDYTVFRGLLEDTSFFAWIRDLMQKKALLEWEDWQASATWGAAEAVSGGVTTLGDCTDSGAALYGAKALGMRGIIYQEVFGMDESQTPNAIVKELQGKVAQLQQDSAGTLLRVGVSPHAPYTVRAALFEALADYAHKNALPVCIHAAESLAEGELFQSGKGIIGEMFVRRGIAWNPPQESTVSYLAKFGILDREAMLVHGVQVSASDRHPIREHDVAWAHCPKSNAKLGVGIAPLGLLGGRQEDGTGSWTTRMGLGSDSVASNNTMDMFEEMRFAVLMQRGARRQVHAMTAKDAVEMATLGGARALRLENEIGSLEAGKRADICAVQLNALHSIPAYNPYSALVYASRASDVVFTMIGGETRYDAQNSLDFYERFPTVDVRALRDGVRAGVEKLRG